MTLHAALVVVAAGLFPFATVAQVASTNLPDAPAPHRSVFKPASPSYSPPTQRERFRNYVRQTYGLMSILEAGAHAGIAQARNNPSEWPQGAEGYGDRFGSAIGEIAIRGTTEYALSDLFREDLRRAECTRPCSESRFKLAFEDTFMARKGADGHEAFSVARIIGPFSGGAVASSVWYPAGTGRSNIPKEAGLQFGLKYIRNLVRESLRH